MTADAKNSLTRRRDFPVVIFQSLIFVVSQLPLVTVADYTTTAAAAVVPTAINVSENINLSTVEIIKSNGYDAEVHKIVTEDGYILELHRIPKNKKGHGPTRNHPVFFHHAFLSTSAEWIIGGSENTSLSFQLVDAGYDVWLANSRGNTYSRKHESLTYKQKAFWNFSLHEIGTYDLPASIDYILTKTNASQLHYIGYSMGTTVFFIMASERPEYQPKIRSQISLAPVAYLSKIRSPIRHIAFYAKMINKLYQMMTNGMVMPHSKLKTFFASTVCKTKITQTFVCQKSIIFFVSGSDPHYFNTKIIPLIMGHFPSGTSSMIIEHFAQFRLRDSFSKFDYGPAVNLQRYNATKPPAYDLKSIRVPITLIYGKNDLIADEEDVMRLKDQLPRLMDVFPVDNPYCNHVDFLWSLKVNEHVNDPVREILRRTDDADWRYTGPSPAAAVAGAPTEPNPSSSVRTSTGYPEAHAAELARERELQKFVFGSLIEFARSVDEKRTGHRETNVQKIPRKMTIDGRIQRATAGWSENERSESSTVV